MPWTRALSRIVNKLMINGTVYLKKIIARLFHTDAWACTPILWIRDTPICGKRKLPRVTCAVKKFKLTLKKSSWNEGFKGRRRINGYRRWLFQWEHLTQTLQSDWFGDALLSSTFKTPLIMTFVPHVGRPCDWIYGVVYGKYTASAVTIIAKHNMLQA